MIYDLRLTIAEVAAATPGRRREEAERSFRSRRGNEAQIFPSASRSSVRSEIFVAHVSAMNFKPRRGGIIWETLRRYLKHTFRDAAPTELCFVGGGDDYKYDAPDGAIREHGNQRWRTV